MQDHLGSNRVVVNQAGGVEQRSDFYPYGGTIPGNLNAEYQPWLYNGKERDMTGLNWYDYGARFLLHARWTTPDPFSEIDYPTSPYIYCANNPINKIDPDGKKWVDAKGNLVWGNGEYTKYATADHKRIGNNLKNTYRGREQFDKLVNHKVPIQTVIDIKTVKIKTEPNGEERITNGDAERTTRNGILESGVITLYEKSLERSAKINGISTDEQLAATTGHEIEHFTEENLQFKDGDENVENEPRAVANDIINEYRSQKPVITPNSFEVLLRTETH